MALRPYDRQAAVLYAHEWAYGRNPKFYDYERIGGDCTNFASQCLFAGSGIMDFTPTFGWYYIDADRKAPAWTGVPYLHQYLTRERPSVGPVGKECQLWELRPGDLVQLRFQGGGLSAQSRGGAGRPCPVPGGGPHRRPQLRRRLPAAFQLRLRGAALPPHPGRPLAGKLTRFVTELSFIYPENVVS